MFDIDLLAVEQSAVFICYGRLGRLFCLVLDKREAFDIFGDAHNGAVDLEAFADFLDVRFLFDVADKNAAFLRVASLLRTTLSRRHSVRSCSTYQRKTAVR
jgi:hypothetical protein